MSDPDYWQLRPRAPALGTVLGPLDAIAEPGAREYVFGRGASAFRMFVVRNGGVARGWLNLCPHFSLPLNRADSFLNEDSTRIRCSQHFAEFRPEDGVCVSGACEGAALDPVPVRLVDGTLVIG